MRGRATDGWVIFTEELRVHVRSRWYVFFTLAVVVALIVASLVVPLFQDRTDSDGETGGRTVIESVGFVDETGLFSSDGGAAAGAPAATGPRRYESRNQGVEALGRGDIESLYVIPSGYLRSGRVEQYAQFEGRFPSNQGAESAFSTWLVEALISDRVDEAVEARVLAPAQFDDFRVQSDGTVAPLSTTAVQIGGILVPMLFAGLLAMSLTLGSGYIVQSVSGEKESRLAEVVITSASSLSVMTGKLLALATVGLAQAGVWMVTAALTVPSTLNSVAGSGEFSISAGLWLTIVACFVTGYLLTTTLAILVGASAPSNREATRLGGWIPLLAFVPFWFSGLILSQPDGLLGRILSYFPFTAPTGLLLRIGGGADVGAGQIVGAMLGVAVAAAVVLWVAARVFRAALLMRGQNASLHNVWVALRDPR